MTPSPETGQGDPGKIRSMNTPTGRTFDQPSQSLRLLDVLLVAVLTAAVFVPNLYGHFSALDDVAMLHDTVAFRHPSWPRYFAFWTHPPYQIFMPLTMTMWQVIALFSHRPQLEPYPWAMAAVGFKAASILVHVLSAAAATWVLSILTRTRWPAIAGGLLFALHPVQVESVCWTTGLKDELCGLFALLTIALYARYLSADAPAPWKSGYWLGAVAAAVGAMLSKPTGMMVPVLLLAVDWALRPAAAPAVRVRTLGLFFLLGLACGTIAFQLQGSPLIHTVPRWARPLLAGDTLAFDLRLVAWPVGMTPDYGRYPLYVWQNGQIWWTWIFPAALVVALAIWRNRWAWLAALLFALPIAPVSGITPFDMQQFSTPADHYLYQPMLGVALALTLLLRARPRWWGAAAVVLAVCGVLSWQGVRIWRQPWDLAHMMLRRNPQSWLARNSLAYLALQVGDSAYAEQMARQSMAIRPESTDPHEIVAVIRLRQGRYRDAVDEAETAIRLDRAKSLPIFARKLVRCAGILQDPALAYRAASYWLEAEPDNELALRLKRNFARAAGASSPTSLPATEPR